MTPKAVAAHPAVARVAVTSALEARLQELESAASGTPLYRLRRWLLNNAQRLRFGPPGRHLACPSSHRGCELSGEAPSQDFLPSPLPGRPRSLFGPAGRELTSRRRQNRRSSARAAWLLTEWQVATFNLFTLGEGSTYPAWKAKLGLRPPSPIQFSAFEKRCSENLRFCRLRLSDEGPSRGIAVFDSLISDFEVRWGAGEFSAGCPTHAFSSSTAMRVDPTRLSVPSQAGSVNPADLLVEPQRSQFLDVSSRIRRGTDAELLPKFCYRVEAQDEVGMRELFIKNGMAVPVAVSKLPSAGDGRTLLSGLFAVKHKAASDRLIFDRRPANHLESRLGWAELPFGPQLCRLVLDSGTAVRGSGDDLRSFFYCLANAPDAIVRNAFGRCFDGAGYEKFGVVAGEQCRMCLRVLAMGDLNAVDISHQSHHSLLSRFGCLKTEDEVIYGRVFPDSDVLELLYIDDHVVLGLCRKDQAQERAGGDLEAIQRSHEAYTWAGLPRAPEKAFGFAAGPSASAAASFVVIGTEVRSEPGTAGAPLEKRRRLFDLGVRALQCGSLTMDLVRRLVALYLHPILHRREIMCVLARVFSWISETPLGCVAQLPADVVQEIVIASILLPAAEAQLRWPVAKRVSATDATPSSGGAVHCRVSDRLAKTLYRASEQRGCYTRLDSPFLSALDGLLPPDPTVARLFESMDWTVHRTRMFRSTQHVNLQELEEIIEELRASVRRGLAPCRLVNGTDSGVCLGAWGKGRSASTRINALLRQSLGWQILGQKALVNLHIRSEANPADAPSRFKPLSPTKVVEPWMLPLLRCDVGSGNIKARVLPEAKEALECFAGAGGLSAALGRAGLRVAVPLEAFPVRDGRASYDPGQDLCLPDVYEALIADGDSGKYRYLHFGFPCRTWGPAGRLAGGTRRVGSPLGDGSLFREAAANRELAVTLLVACCLVRAGCHVSWENPLSSYAWQAPLFEEFGQLVRLYEADFDQCMFGLKFPGAPSSDFCKKPTKVVGTFRTVSDLARRCCGVSGAHKHVRAWGSYSHEGKRISRASAAGRYPGELCRRWAQALARATDAPVILRTADLVRFENKVRAMLR